jgi:hypothetical protein
MLHIFDEVDLEYTEVDQMTKKYSGICSLQGFIACIKNMLD